MTDDFTTANEPTATPGPESTPLPPADINLSFTEMADPYAAPEPEPDIFDSDRSGIAGAAKELVKRRSSLERPIVDREYRRVSDNEPSPANEFISAERAADDLARVRSFEEAQLAELQKDAVRAEHDALRGQAQPEQPAPAPETPPLEAQPEQAEQPGETKLQRALREDAEFRGQVEAMVAAAEKYQQEAAAQLQAEKTRLQQEYTARVNQAALETQALVGQLIPELAGATSDAVATDRLNQLRVNNPARHAQIVSILEHARSSLSNATRDYQEQLANYHQSNAQAQEAQRAQFSQWAEQEDLKFEKAVASDGPQALKEVKERVGDVLKNSYGIDARELRQLYDTQPWLRSSSAQRLVYDAVRFQLSKEALANNRHHPIPQVVKPGVTSEPLRAADGRFSSLQADFAANPTAKAGAALIAARRAAGGR